MITGKREQISLEELSNLSFHDQCIETLNIDFSSNDVKIKVGVFNDFRSGYDFVELIFNNVEQLSIENFNVEFFLSCEVYSHEVKIKEDKAVIKIIFLPGPNKPTATITFSFSQCYKVYIECLNLT